ncbi:sugar efflux transporter [Dactylosporangium cerinum]|uniref:Sugar efflux transporter n=1 Tax=Dactylosporangium cerinum TaxID=1434730 RepID=A0ABV9VPL5_9ACTN
MDSTNPGLAHLIRDGALRRIMANTALVGLVGAVMNTSTSLFLATAIGATPLMIGLYFTGRGLLEVVAGLTLGALSDRTGNRRALLTLCSFVSAGGALAYATIRNYYVLFAVGAVLFAIGGSGFAQLFAYNRDFASARALNPTLLNSVLRSITSACWIVGPPLGFFLIAVRGFTTLYLIIAVLCVTSGVVCRWLLPDLTDTVTKRTAKGNPFTGIGRSLWLLILAVMLMLTVNIIYQINIALFVTRDLGLDTGFTGLLLGFCAALEVGVILLLGRHADRIGKWRLVLAATACATIFFAALPFVHSKAGLLLLQLPNAFWTAIVLSIPVTILQDAMGDRVGVASSLYTSSFQVGILLGGTTAGVVAEWLGFTDVFFVCAALAAAATVFLAAAARLTRARDQAQASVPATASPGPAT